MAYAWRTAYEGMWGKKTNLNQGPFLRDNCREGWLITRRPPGSRWTSGLAEAMIPCPRCEKRVLIRELCAHQKLTCRSSFCQTYFKCQKKSTPSTTGCFFFFFVFVFARRSCFILLLHFLLQQQYSPVSYSHVKLCQVINVSMYLLNSTSDENYMRTMYILYIYMILWWLSNRTFVVFK